MFSFILLAEIAFTFMLVVATLHGSASQIFKIAQAFVQADAKHIPMYVNINKRLWILIHSDDWKFNGGTM